MVTNNKFSMLILLICAAKLHGSELDVRMSTAGAEGSGVITPAAQLTPRGLEAQLSDATLLMRKTTTEVFESPLAQSPQRRRSLNSSMLNDSSFINNDTRLHDVINSEGLDDTKTKEKLDALLRENSSLLNSVDGKNHTALYYAVLKGKLEVVKFLLEICAADSRVMYDDGVTLLDIAMAQGSVEMVRYLALYIPLHIANGKGELPLVCAMRHPNEAFKEKLVSVLLAFNTDFIEYEQNDGVSALTLAAEITRTTGNSTLEERLKSLLAARGDIDKLLALNQGTTHDERVAQLARKAEAEKKPAEIITVTQNESTVVGTVVKGGLFIGLVAAVGYFAFKAGKESVEN